MPRPSTSTLFPYTTLFRSHSPSVFVQTRVAAIGPATADALRAVGVQVELVPKGFVAESLVDALATRDRKSTRLNSSHTVISYAVLCLKKKNKICIEYPRHT